MSVPTKALEPFIDAIADRVLDRMAGPRVLSLRNVSERLECTEKHVRHLITAGQLKPVDIGLGETTRTLRVSTDELRRYLELKGRAA